MIKMLGSLLLDFSIGLLMWVSLCSFYGLTQVFGLMPVFGFTLDFWRYNFFKLVDECCKAPILGIFYAISFFVQLSISLIWFFIRIKISREIDVFDIIFICLTPAITIFLFALPSFPEKDIYYYTAVLIVNGLIGWIIFLYLNSLLLI